MSVRPADFPPPYDPEEFVAEPSDPADERIGVGALIAQPRQIVLHERMRDDRDVIHG